MKRLAQYTAVRSSLHTLASTELSVWYRSINTACFERSPTGRGEVQCIMALAGLTFTCNPFLIPSTERMQPSRAVDTRSIYHLASLRSSSEMDTMASSDSRLLTIPVEIRRQILSHLTTEVKSRWRWNYWPLSGNSGISTIHLHGMPSLNVVLSCTRLCEESLALSNTNQLSVVIDLSLDNRYTNIIENNRDQTINEYILPRIVSATINAAAPPGGQLGDHIWFNISILGKALAARSSNLKTITLVTKSWTKALEAQRDGSLVYGT